ncbi:RloB-like protein [Promicromonospora umidemergens]|uniref:RloB-like protein n=1 Tax=Promicromonospora umidemergens TaxID=629679 RepID=A0ABP8WG05_9MICO|nr:RloB family protein [Promicromonospora umidemergens]MCP2284042.1 RloB-like protein [Promicromonospora umidemergens]
MGSKSLKRKVAIREPKRTILVFTEGTVTEPAYVKELKRLDHVRQSTSIRVEIAGAHTVPYPLVERALDHAADSEIDDIWCLFDVESPQPHPRLKEAAALAAKNDKVHLAISNPCFELWLLLHHQDVTRHLSTADACKLANSLDGLSDKQLKASEYVPLRDEAARRARLLAQQHRRAGRSFPDDNPTTDIHLFVEAVEAAARKSSP